MINKFLNISRNITSRSVFLPWRYRNVLFRSELIMKVSKHHIQMRMKLGQGDRGVWIRERMEEEDEDVVLAQPVNPFCGLIQQCLWLIQLQPWHWWSTCSATTTAAILFITISLAVHWLSCVKAERHVCWLLSPLCVVCDVEMLRGLKITD